MKRRPLSDALLVAWYTTARRPWLGNAVEYVESRRHRDPRIKLLFRDANPGDATAAAVAVVAVAAIDRIDSIVSRRAPTASLAADGWGRPVARRPPAEGRMADNNTTWLTAARRQVLYAGRHQHALNGC